jgi:type I restriction enzyme S subunit
MFIWRPIDEAVLLPELLLGVAGSERFQRHVEQMARGSVNKFVTWSDVKDFLFDLPPIEEQRYIVELLRAVDDEIDAVIQALKTAEAFIPIGFEQLTSSADGSRISLAEALSDVRAGVSVTGLGRPPRDDEDSIIKVSAVKDAKFVSSERKALSPNHNLPDSALITRGDILITRSNTARLVGKVARVQELPSGRIYCPDTIYRLIVNREIVLPEYLELACLTPDFHRAIQQEAKGSSGSMQKISIKRLLSIVIWVPGNLADQERIVTAARALREVADSISDVASRASGLRSSLLRELIR